MPDFLSVQQQSSLINGLFGLVAGTHLGLRRLIAAQTAPRPVTVIKVVASDDQSGTKSGNQNWKPCAAFIAIIVALEAALIYGFLHIKNAAIVNGVIVTLFACIWWNLLNSHMNESRFPKSFQWTAEGKPSFQVIPALASEPATFLGNTLPRALRLMASPIVVFGLIYGTWYLYDGREDYPSLDEGLKASRLLAPLLGGLHGIPVQASAASFAMGLTYSKGYVKKLTLILFGGQIAFSALFVLGSLILASLPDRTSDSGGDVSTADPDSGSLVKFYPWVLNLCTIMMRCLAVQYPIYIAAVALRFDWLKHNLARGLPLLTSETVISLSDFDCNTAEKSSTGPQVVKESTVETAEMETVPVPTVSPGFPKPYFYTTAGSLAVFNTAAILTGADDTMTMLLAFASCWIMGGLMIGIATVKGDLRALWEYEETWELSATVEVVDEGEKTVKGAGVANV